MVGEISIFLILYKGPICLLIFGVQGDLEAFAVSFEPLAVFFSIQMTLWYCGDDDAGRGLFPCIRCTERLGRMVGDRKEKKLIAILISGYLMCITCPLLPHLEWWCFLFLGNRPMVHIPVGNLLSTMQYRSVLRLDPTGSGRTKKETRIRVRRTAINCPHQNVCRRE